MKDIITTTKKIIKLSEIQIINELEMARNNAAEGNYRSADDVVKDLRTKYKL